jgi:hypothetical protein
MTTTNNSNNAAPYAHDTNHHHHQLAVFPRATFRRHVTTSIDDANFNLATSPATHRR